MNLRIIKHWSLLMSVSKELPFCTRISALVEYIGVTIYVTYKNATKAPSTVTMMISLICCKNIFSRSAIVSCFFINASCRAGTADGARGNGRNPCPKTTPSRNTPLFNHYILYPCTADYYSATELFERYFSISTK